MINAGFGRKSERRQTADALCHGVVLFIADRRLQPLQERRVGFAEKGKPFFQVPSVDIQQIADRALNDIPLLKD
ncbi:hypothetical protein D3C73_1411870 [compost metagenome]